MAAEKGKGASIGSMAASLVWRSTTKYIKNIMNIYFSGNIMNARANSQVSQRVWKGHGTKGSGKLVDNWGLHN